MTHTLALALVRLRPGEFSDPAVFGNRQSQIAVLRELWWLGWAERVPGDHRRRVRLTLLGERERERVLQEARELLEASP